MLIKDITFPNPQENILYDEVLLSLAQAQQGEEILRFWESTGYFIVLGRIGKAEEDIKIDNVKKNRIQVLRRYSGGGTVVQGPGCLNYTLVLSKSKHGGLNDIRKSYDWIMGKMVQAFQKLGVEAVYRPVSDLALKENEMKFSGNAQHRTKNYLLHHGTILYQFNLELIELYLKMPKDIPLYRQGRSHRDFVANISVPSEKIKQSVQSQFAADGAHQGLTVAEIKKLKRFLEEKSIFEFNFKDNIN